MSRRSLDKLPVEVLDIIFALIYSDRASNTSRRHLAAPLAVNHLFHVVASRWLYRTLDLHIGMSSATSQAKFIQVSTHQLDRTLKNRPELGAYCRQLCLETHSLPYIGVGFLVGSKSAASIVASLSNLDRVTVRGECNRAVQELLVQVTTSARRLQILSITPSPGSFADMLPSFLALSLCRGTMPPLRQLEFGGSVYWYINPPRQILQLTMQNTISLRSLNIPYLRAIPLVLDCLLLWSRGLEHFTVGPLYDDESLPTIGGIRPTWDLSAFDTTLAQHRRRLVSIALDVQANWPGLEEVDFAAFPRLETLRIPVSALGPPATFAAARLLGPRLHTLVVCFELYEDTGHASTVFVHSLPNLGRTTLECLAAIDGFVAEHFDAPEELHDLDDLHGPHDPRELDGFHGPYEPHDPLELQALQQPFCVRNPLLEVAQTAVRGQLPLCAIRMLFKHLDADIVRHYTSLNVFTARQDTYIDRDLLAARVDGIATEIRTCGIAVDCNLSDLHSEHVGGV